MLLLVPYDGSIVPEDVDFRYAEIWLQIFKLPVGLRSEKVLQRIGDYVGEFMKITLTAFGGIFYVFVSGWISGNP